MYKYWNYIIFYIYIYVCIFITKLDLPYLGLESLGLVLLGDFCQLPGFAVERRQIMLDRPIKAVGLYDLRVNLHPEVAVTVKANIARSEEEAKIQAETGRAVIHQEEEEPFEEEAALPAAEKAEGAEEGGQEPPVEADASAPEALPTEPSEDGNTEAAPNDKSE